MNDVRACPVCGAVATQLACVKNGYDHVACDCGSVYVSTPIDANAVDPTVDGHSNPFYALPATMKVRWLRRTIAPGRLLEVGCGNGAFLTAAQAAGFDVQGIEPDQTRAEFTERRLGVAVERGLIENTQLPDAGFDVVYCCDLLAHFPDPARALQQIRRVLAPRGTLFVEAGLLGGFRRYWLGRMPASAAPKHRWYPTRGGLCRLLDDHGFEVSRVRCFGLAAQALTDQLVYGIARRLAAPRSESSRPTALDRYANFMRYRVGALIPAALGPSTAFVLARKAAGS